MNQSDGWLLRRSRIRRDIARSFAERSAISFRDFVGAFYDSSPPPPAGDFDGQYIPDEATLEEIFAAIGLLTGLPARTVEAHFSRKETFPQFAERLLRAGAYLSEER
jgi:hypothetical protein